MKIKIRDARNGEWSWVYNALLADPHLTPAAKLIYSSLCTYGGCEKIYPTLEQIAKRVDMSRSIAKRSIKKLQDIGYIEIKKGGGRGKANEYLLLKMPKGCIMCPLSGGKKGYETNVKGVHNDPEKGYIIPPNKIRQEDKQEDNPSAQALNGKEIVGMISLFKEVNPLIGKQYGSPPQRKAVERMLGVFGRAKLEAMIKSLPIVNAKQYWPKSTTPCQLENNIPIYKAKNTEEKLKGQNLIGIAIL